MFFFGVDWLDRTHVCPGNHRGDGFIRVRHFTKYNGALLTGRIPWSLLDLDFLGWGCFVYERRIFVLCIRVNSVYPSTLSFR